jgi:Nuclease-related domain
MADDGETTTRARTKRTTYVDERTWAAFGEFKAGIIGRKGESAVARTLGDLGVPALHDVLLADLMGLTQVDHLVRARDAILVIETKTYGGHITGAVDRAEWVQHLANDETRHAFQNPAYQNHRHCRVVEAIVAGLDVRVAGCVVFAGTATFCDELQGAVVPTARLPALFRGNPPRVCNALHLDRAWERLIVAAAAGAPRRKEHMETVCLRRA